MTNITGSMNMLQKAEEREFTNRYDPLSIREPWIEHTMALIKIASRMQDTQDPKSVLCHTKFVHHVNVNCSYRFGNLLHVQTNAYVIAAALGRPVIFDGGTRKNDCEYFDRVDYTAKDSLNTTSLNRMCPDEHITLSADHRFHPSQNSWLFRCNDTIDDLERKQIISIPRLMHQNSGALFQNILIQERKLAKLTYPTNFDDEIQFFQRYEIFGVVSKLILPLRLFVKQYIIEPDPTNFDVLLGVHLRHPRQLRDHHNVENMDREICHWIINFIEKWASTKSCAVLLGTEDIVSTERISRCVKATSCSFLEIVPVNATRRKSNNPPDKGDIGILMAVRVLHALSVLSTHLLTTEESSFSKLIAERWIANKGVTATLGKWWVMPLYKKKNHLDTNKTIVPKSYETNYEGWEEGHSKMDCEVRIRKKS